MDEICGCSSMVERNLPKVDVAGSSPVIRSTQDLPGAGPFYLNERKNHMKYRYIPRGVCSRMIEVEIDNDIIKDCRFLGGCSGNTQGVSALVKGMNVYDAIERLEGIDCAGRGTSCPDQLSKALKEAIA